MSDPASIGAAAGHDGGGAADPVGAAGGLPGTLRPHVLDRPAFGRISIADADAGAAAFTNTATDPAERAVQECLCVRGLT